MSTKSVYIKVESLMPLQEDTEMTDTEIMLRFGSLINETTVAFLEDANYAADLIKKAKMIETRRARRSS